MSHSIHISFADRSLPVPLCRTRLPLFVTAVTVHRTGRVCRAVGGHSPFSPGSVTPESLGPRHDGLARAMQRGADCKKAEPDGIQRDKTPVLTGQSGQTTGQHGPALTG